MIEFMEARTAAPEPIRVPSSRMLRLRQSLRRRFLPCGSPPNAPSGGANAANVVARRANERGPKRPKVPYRGGNARHEEDGTGFAQRRRPRPHRRPLPLPAPQIRIEGRFPPTRAPAVSTRSEAVDQDTRRSEAGQLDHRCGSELDNAPQAAFARVARVPRCDLEPSFEDGREELGWDQVNLPELG